MNYKDSGVDIKNVKDADFNPVKQIKYRRSSDILKGVKSKYSDVSNNESIDRIYKYDGDIELKGVMGEISRLCYEKEFKEAFELIKSQSRAYLENSIYWNQVGTCYLQEGNLRKALLFYNKALSLRKNYAPALNNLGVMYVKKNDFPRAMVAFERARKTRKFSRVPRLNLANLYLSYGLYDHALSEVNVLKSLTKTDVDVQNISATAQLMKNNVKQSLKEYGRIERDFYEHPKVGLNYALALYLNKDTEKAIDVFEDVDLKIDNSWSSYHSQIKSVLGVK